MADELRIMPRKRAGLSDGNGAFPMQGAHIRPATANGAIDAGNSESYTVPSGTDYLELVATADLYYRISSAGSSAVVDQDEFLAAGAKREVSEIYDNSEFRKIRAGDIVKCVVDS